MNRWTKHEPEKTGLAPAAILSAQYLEQRGFVQAHPNDMNDGEGVILVAGHDGSRAVARYYRKAQPDEKGLRERHEFETWPDTPHAERFRYADGEPEGGKGVNGIGVFRLSAPDHIDDVAALYDARFKQHRDDIASD